MNGSLEGVEMTLPHWLQSMLMLLAEAWSSRRDAQIRFLKAQVELLRQRIPGNRVILCPEDRLRLLRLGEAMDHRVDDLLGIVSVKTYGRWLRERRGGREPGRVGRPKRLTASVRALIVRLARENIGWGARRIVGELRKLAVPLGRTSVRRVLTDEGILPDPDRHAPRGVVTPWRTFIAGHANVMVACDFFCKTVWTLLGKRVAYALTFIHLGSRKVFVSPATFHPTGEWLQQQARNVRMWLEDEGIDLRFLIHDPDTKFTDAFDEHFNEIVRTPFQAPIANCFAESWIANLKRECLNAFFCFSLRHLDYIVQTYARFYNTARPHQSMGNVPLEQPRDPPSSDFDHPSGPVHRTSELGGLLNHYHRKAA